MKKAVCYVMFLALLLGGSMLSAPALARSGGSGGVDTIKVNKCFYVASNGTMLVNAPSSNSSAPLYLYLPSGRYVGEVLNGGGGWYGRTVFYVGADPVFVTIISSAGGSITIPTVPYQP